MKKICLADIKQNLTKNELKQIIAGSGDTNNHNSVWGCECFYTNNSVINNTNDVTGCICRCFG